MLTRPRSHPHPSSSRTARDHTRARSSRSTRGGQTSAASRSHASTSRLLVGVQLASRGRGRWPLRGVRLPVRARRGRAARRRARPASGQAVGDHQLDRGARRQAARERGVIRATSRAAPPAMPHAGLDIHRAGRVAVAVRMRVRTAKHPAGASRLAHPASSIPSAR
jgi:hypothetical protein